MAVMHDNFSNLADRIFVHQVVGRLIGAIPGRLVIHQNLNLPSPRRFLDGACIFEADRQRLFHHHRNAIPRADLHHAAMIVGVGVREYRLRMRHLQHFLQVGIEETWRQAEPLRELCCELAIGFGNSDDLQVVGIAEADRQLTAQFTKRFGLAPGLFYSDLEEMLKVTHPQAVLAYTNTYDHRRVVEICARYSVPVMMEKPLAVSLEDARAIEKAARAGKIQVLVNYETTWYRANQAAYDLTHESAIGEIRKIVVHDGHQGPKEIGVGPEFLAWLTDPKLNGAGALFDFGCYGADLATWLMDGRRPDSVTAVTQQIKPDVSP